MTDAKNDLPFAEDLGLSAPSSALTEAFASIDCILCESAARERGEIEWFWSRFPNYCPTCGSKRCPRSTWHGNPCTGSNEPGQVGSVYGLQPYKLDEVQA